jgi:uncharacterized membrane protein
MMMKRLLGTFVLGLAALLPVVVLVYAAGRLLLGIEQLARNGLLIWLPDSLRFPGLGLAVAVAAIITAGLVARSWVGPPIGRFISARVGRIPLIGSIYLSLRDVTRRFSRSQPIGFTAVVYVPSGHGGGRLGLIADLEPLATPVGGEALVPVYIPASFQPGGHLELVPATRLEITEISIEDALSLTLSGGLARGDGRGAEAFEAPRAPW